MFGEHGKLNWILLLASGALGILVWWAEYLKGGGLVTWICYLGAIAVFSGVVAIGLRALEREERDARRIRALREWLALPVQGRKSSVGEAREAELGQWLEGELEKPHPVWFSRLEVWLLLGLVMSLLVLVMASADGPGAVVQTEEPPPVVEEREINEDVTKVTRAPTVSGQWGWLVAGSVLIAAGVALVLQRVLPPGGIGVGGGILVALMGVLSLKPSLKVELPVELEFKRNVVSGSDFRFEMIGPTAPFFGGEHWLREGCDGLLDDPNLRLRTWLSKEGIVGFAVIGHADRRSFTGGNRRLAESRASWVANCLEENGSVPVLLRLAGAPLNFGTDDPVHLSEDRQAIIFGVVREGLNEPGRALVDWHLRSDKPLWDQLKSIFNVDSERRGFGGGSSSGGGGITATGAPF